MQIRLPANWKIEYQDRNGFRMTSEKYPKIILFWEYKKDGFCWHVEKLSESGRLQSGQYDFYKNFSDAIKSIKDLK